MTTVCAVLEFEFACEFVLRLLELLPLFDVLLLQVLDLLLRRLQLRKQLPQTDKEVICLM